ncbi:LPXTG cell wall anchor domain-containing protein [Glutamicibacter arilaitensis]|uniref:LPXTG cell wall anchor domain-containing protein n=1 Tax=Glutamicibacter arilaitensis TaxID=256701 RepID=A0A2N7S7G0_9MICC|nr:hypothetical protein CIK84_10310 [Glutamicibacter arilaitensis]
MFSNHFATASLLTIQVNLHIDFQFSKHGTKQAVGSIGKVIATKAQKAGKSTEPVAAVEASAPALANTGIDGFWTAGVGILLAIGGVVFIARSRKASAK